MCLPFDLFVWVTECGVFCGVGTVCQLQYSLSGCAPGLLQSHPGLQGDAG